MSFSLNSEYGTLKSLIMHRPGKEIDWLNPSNKGEYLFDDIPFLDEIQKEHDEYAALINQASGARVFKVHELLKEVFRDKTIAEKYFYNDLLSLGLGDHVSDIVSHFSATECANALLSGITINELKRKMKGGTLFKNSIDNTFLITPSPNFYFMRDPAAVVQNGIISCQMKFPGRQRESGIMRIIFENHPYFKPKTNFIYPLNSSHHVEGGDVIILSKKALAIGNSERTDSKAIEQIAHQVLKSPHMERVYEVNLPKKRNFMHLDTVFALVDENLIVTYPEAIESVVNTIVYHKESIDNNGEVVIRKEILNKSILTILSSEIRYLEVVETGDGNPYYAAREQWYDGANVFALGPRKVASYNRNKYTNKALRDAGVEVFEIRSSELSRGLGGPRCMTLPLEREESE